MQQYQRLHHDEIQPVFAKDSRILILGTFPSAKSREAGFFYGHPQNRFWRVLASLTKEPLPGSMEEKKQLLYKHKIALWDVIQSCDILGSSDASIKNVVVADIPRILSDSPIEKIFGNGAKACQLYDKYLLSQTNMPIQKLPSTSPANAAYSLDKLLQAWSIILFTSPTKL